MEKTTKEHPEAVISPKVVVEAADTLHTMINDTIERTRPVRVKHVKQLLVVPQLPERLRPLQEMTHNLWYSWNSDIIGLLLRLDADLWNKVGHNPVEFLTRLPQQKLKRAVEDEAFLATMDKVYDRFQDYLSRKKWFHFKHSQWENNKIAYFSLEYGLDAGLPVYSGGLGILAGDTLKAASDLGLPFAAIGLLYRDGYFRQSISADGWQQERYEANNWYNMPVKLVNQSDGQPLRIQLQLDGIPVQAQIWKVEVGLVPLYLLDTNVPENSMRAREITSVLYGGDKDLRIRQELVLGIGGIRALEALGFRPDVVHMNEGHSWFLVLERIRQMMDREHLSFAEASLLVWSTTIFTTHTPVPAGNEQFDPALLGRYVGEYIKSLGLDWETFVNLGRIVPNNEQEQFGMTVAALRTAAFCNGVSELHGKVSRGMWQHIWPELPKEEVPIKSITNGVHIASWVSHDMSELFESYFGPKFIERPGAPEIWERVYKIPDSELWRVHERRRERLVFEIRRLVREQLVRRGASLPELQQAEQLLDPKVLTIGFARRFSTYKRGNLIFRDLERIERILHSSTMPVQLVIAGKAHPSDQPGKEVIREIVNHLTSAKFAGKVVFLEDYDIRLARYLVQGCDVWLNNPRRPEEASGTSGMKAALNGVLHCSILDGWWVEGYSELSGFKIGNGEEFPSLEQQNAHDSEALYSVLERELIPLFYSRENGGLPSGWIRKMKGSIHMAGQRFSAQRMLMDYANHFYVNGLELASQLRTSNYKPVRELSGWLSTVEQSWNGLKIEAIDLPDQLTTTHVDQAVPIQLRLRLGSLRPEDVRVELVSGQLTSQEELADFVATPAKLVGPDGEAGVYIYRGEIRSRETGRIGLSARVSPEHPLLVHNRRPRLITWW